MVRKNARALAGIVALLFCSCGKNEKPATPPEPSAPSIVRLSAAAAREAGIETAAVAESTFERPVTLTGTLAAKPWTPEEQAAVNEAQSADARRRLAEAGYRRLSRLYADGITARQDLDAARAERDQAEAAAAEADAKRANLGLSAASAALEGRSRIWGLASLSDVDLTRVRPGARVDVTTSAFPAAAFSGQVVEISRSEDPETRTFTVRIAVEDPSERLRPQMLATFAVSTPAASALVVPRSAVLLEGDGSWVYVAEGTGFRRVHVATGAGTADRVPVLSGLSAGQRVVTAGSQVLESERLKGQLKPPDED